MAVENEVEYNCSRCDAKFFTQSELFEHFRTFHRYHISKIDHKNIVGRINYLFLNNKADGRISM